MFCVGFSILSPLVPEGLTGLGKEPTWIGMQECQFWESPNMDAEPMRMVAWRNRHETKQQLSLNKFFCVSSLPVLPIPACHKRSRPSLGTGPGALWTAL